LGEPYRGEIEVICEDADVEGSDLVGVELSLRIHRGDVERVVSGIVQEVEVRDGRGDHTRLVLRFGPALALLARGRGSRIFQRMTVLEVVEDLAGPTLTERDREFDLSAVGRGFTPRDYCVQYQESDLAFLHRLLDEEGLSYRFDHDDQQREATVVTDGGDGARDLEAWAGGAEVRLVVDRHDEAEAESIRSIARRGRTAGPTIVHRNWDWATNPARVYEDSAPARDDSDLVVIEHGGRRLWNLDTADIAARDQEALASGEDVLEGAGNVVSFAPGCVFELLDSDHDGRYLITRVEHRGDAPEVDVHDGTQAAAPTYDNDFTCLPAEVTYRCPGRSTKPLIHGPQTAVVVGPEGEEIHTDEHGRIKVRFHWDRSTTHDEDASCWVRVAQTWAGPGWGSVFIPRIGMEVIVSFLDGDPDRPLCTGCVFNGQNAAPYPLPEGRTKTAFRTRSTPGGDGYNELCFEDAAGAEQVMLRAQRDYSETVQHDRSRSVGNDEAVSVAGGRTVAVEGNQLLTVNGKGHEGEALASPHYGIEVDGDYSMRAEHDALVEAKSSIRLRCGETYVELTPNRITLQAGNGAHAILDVLALLKSKPGAFVHLDDEGHATMQSTGPAWLTLDNTARLHSKAGSVVKLTGEAEVRASAPGDGASGASLLLNSDATLQGNQVTVMSDGGALTMTEDITLDAESIKSLCDKMLCSATQQISLSGGNVDVAGQTLTTITAPLVKIN
jgi:type VI secretion system secreted protein VgrG